MTHGAGATFAKVSEADAAKIKSSLANLQDVKRCDTDWKEGIVEVALVEGSGLDAVIAAIEEAGFAVIDVVFY
ncbi:MAG: heavy metal-associated domain-containing protein [Candidatus Brocadiales bacterium]